MPKPTQWCRFFLEIHQPLTSKVMDDICTLTENALHAAKPKLKNKIHDFRITTETDHTEECVTISLKAARAKTPALFIHFDVDAKAKKADDLLEATTPILRKALEAAGFKLIQGWGERRKKAKARFYDY